MRRSNPDCRCGKTLDCFASLAMTEDVDRVSHHSPAITPPPESSLQPRRSRRDNRRPDTSRA
ncbi:hypothetical protein C7G41_04785 [Bradyrhizobium sp. MOS002]|nr:hypothetical protein C7G41_04785 [Bradyrhizobium sp. MOS002]